MSEKHCCYPVQNPEQLPGIPAEITRDDETALIHRLEYPYVLGRCGDHYEVTRVIGAVPPREMIRVEVKAEVLSIANQAYRVDDQEAVCYLLARLWDLKEEGNPGTHLREMIEGTIDLLDAIICEMNATSAQEGFF